MQNLVFHVTF